MKAYVIRPDMDVFDATGTLTTDASQALRVIAQLVTEALRQGGDNSHSAVVWDGPSDVQTTPTIISVSDRAALVATAFRLLDPNDLLGGDIRSAVNCRAATFGQDGQAMVCLMHEDAEPVAPDGLLLSIAECSDWLAATDLFDGTWPNP